MQSLIKVTTVAASSASVFKSVFFIIIKSPSPATVRVTR